MDIIIRIMETLIVGQIEKYKQIKEYLDENSIFCNENNIIYNIGKWKAKKLLKYCEENNCEIIFATIPESTDLITNKLSTLKGKTYFIPQYAYEKINDTESFRKYLFSFDIRKPCLVYMEFHVIDTCNLKCKGCTHFSNIELDPCLADYEQYVEDLKKLKKLFWNISTIRLLGGEPLLNPALPKFIDVTREYFPATNLHVVSNGLLIPNMSDEVVEHMKLANAIFDISNYPPTNKISEKIITKLDTENIDYIYNCSEKPEFSKLLTDSPKQDGSKSYATCVHIDCNFLRNGTLSICPITALIDKYNKVFGTNYPEHETNVLADFTDGWELLNKLDTPISLCNWCYTDNPEKFKWALCHKNKAKADDWVMSENKVSMLKKQSVKHQFDVKNSRKMTTRCVLRQKSIRYNIMRILIYLNLYDGLLRTLKK